MLFSEMEEKFQVNEISDSLSRILSPMNFPSDVLKWMKLNAKPKMALKLMKVCKYFRHSGGFPYLVVKRVLTHGSEWVLFTLDGRKIEIKNAETITQKLWIIGSVEIYASTKVSTLLSNTVVCNVQKIRLLTQQISFKEFKFLTDGGMVEECNMDEATIVSENGEMVPLEDIFECLPNARVIDIRCQVPSLFSLEAAEAKISSKLKELNLWISPPTNFNVLTLFEYMKNHQKIQYIIRFSEISTKEFAENIDPSVKKMIQEWSPEYKKPEVIRFNYFFGLFPNY